VLLATQVNADKVKAVEQYKGKCEPVFMFYKVRGMLTGLAVCVWMAQQGLDMCREALRLLSVHSQRTASCAALHSMIQCALHLSPG
jgi:hypothetical protein